MIQEDLGKLILRLTAGGTMVLHGIGKVQNGVGGIEQMLAGHGLPEFIAYGVYIGEIVIPILLIVGLLTRFSGVVLAFNMVMAIFLAHGDEVFALTDRGVWAIESAGFFLFMGIAIALLGAGRFSIDHIIGAPARRKALEDSDHRVI